MPAFCSEQFYMCAYWLSLLQGTCLTHTYHIPSLLDVLMYLQAEQFKWNSKKLSLMALWQKYAPLVVIALVVGITVWYKFR
jgi:hypothetical protein